MREEFRGHARHVDNEIEAIEQGTGNALLIFLYCAGCATARFSCVAEVTARAGVHGRNKHKPRGKLSNTGSARDGYDAVFKRLAKIFKNRTRELGKLVEKEYAAMRE